MYLEVQVPPPIEVEQCPLVEAFVACLDEVRLSLQELILGLVKLSDGSLAVLIFRLHQLEGILRAHHCLEGALFLGERIQGIIIHLLDFLIKRLFGTLEFQFLVLTIGTGTPYIVAHLETAEDRDVQVQADELTEIVLDLFAERIGIIGTAGIVVRPQSGTDYAPDFDGIEDALDTIVEAIKKAGYEPGKDVKIAMDCAASEFATCENGEWFYDYRQLKNGAKKDPNGKKLSADEQIAYLEQLITKYPIDSIEDGLDENDWDNWVKLTEKIGDRCQLVGDDLFVTNTKFLEKGIKMGAANSILIKVNQIGSLTATLEAIEMAHRHGYTTVTSHRSGETEDTTIADIAVATNSGQIKTGSLSRTDRMAKYNQLIRIEEELGDTAAYGYKRLK